MLEHISAGLGTKVAGFYSGVTDRQGDHALILKALLTYLAGIDDDVVQDVLKLGKVDESVFRSFMRLNAGSAALKAGFEPLSRGATEYLRRHQLNLPADIARLAAHFAPTPLNDPRMPFFLDAPGIYERVRDSQQGRNLLKQYAGCWRVFRFTSERNSNLLTRGFLNIKPAKVLKVTGQTAPCFAYNFREGRADVSDREGAAVGLIFPFGERVMLMGSRTTGAEGSAHAVIMQWVPLQRAPENEEHVERAVGLFMGPNASAEPVTSFLWAYWIPKTDNLDSQQYKDLRRNEARAIQRYNLGNPEHLSALRTAMEKDEFFEDFNRQRTEQDLSTTIGL